VNDGFYFEIAFVLLLILLNGVFAAAEIAVVTASRGRLQSLAESGDRRAAAALRLKSDPDLFSRPSRSE
jgi:putative hemolysin